VTTDTDALLATVREACIDWTRDTREWKIAPRDVEAALDSLSAELERRDQARVLACEKEASANDSWADAVARLRVAEAELERVKAERDEIDTDYTACAFDLEARERDCRGLERLLSEERARLDKALSALREHEHTTQTEISLQIGEATCSLCAAIVEIEGEA
jgi:chromosome segregation ATPase